MKRIARLTFAVLLLVAGCGNRAKQGAHEEHDEGAEEEHGEGEEHEEHGGDAHEEVRLSAEAITRSGIRTDQVRSERLIGGVNVPAVLEPGPDQVAHVTSLVQGQLASVKASLGDRVRKGQVLALVRSVELGEGRANIARAHAGVDVARSNFERQEELQRAGIGARREFVEAQGALRQAEAELAAAGQRVRVLGAGGSGTSSAITSPLDGQVVERHATVGEVVDAENTLFVIADLRHVWAVGRVYEQDVAAAQVGAPAILTLQSYPGRSWSGTIGFVAGRLDEQTRTLEMRMELENTDGLLRPGLFGNMSISPAGSAGTEVPAVSEQAIQRVRDREVVFVPGDAPGEFRPVPVTTGARRGERVEIRSGLSVGQTYVSEGSFTLKSELLRGEMGEGHAH